MATTSNYGWTTPDDSSLVKDGASAIRALGTAIDTSMNTALGTKKSGLVLLNTTSFSAVASQSFNSVFSATYNSYFITNDFTATSADCFMLMRLRASGTDATTNYNSQSMFAEASTVATSFNGTGTDDIEVGGIVSAYPTQNFSQIFVRNPFLTSDTKFRNSYVRRVSAGAINMSESSGFNSNATSYDGFTLLSHNGSTFSGTTRIFGLAL